MKLKRILFAFSLILAAFADQQQNQISQTNLEELQIPGFDVQVQKTGESQTFTFNEKSGEGQTQEQFETIQLNGMFNTFDVDKDGLATPQEILAELKNQAGDGTQDYFQLKVRPLIEKHDVNGDGLSFEQFKNLARDTAQEYKKTKQASQSKQENTLQGSQQKIQELEIKDESEPLQQVQRQKIEQL